MVDVEDLIEALNDPKLIERAAEDAREITFIAEVQARLAINDYNNAVNYFIRGY